MATAATFAVLGCLAYYLPIYCYPQFFPVAQVSLPFLNTPLPLAWGAFLWGMALMMLELWFREHVDRRR